MALHTVTVLFLACIVCQASCSWLEVLRRSATDSEQCERLSQAFDNLWDAIPDDILIEDLTTSDRAPSGNYKEFIANSYSQYSGMVGFNTPSNNIDTHEGRKEVACKLAGVHNIDDFVNLFGDNVPQFRLRTAYRQAQAFFQGDLGMAALEDLREFIKMDLYFMRITGFPNFPLDIYDIDMARYIIKRLMSHKLALKIVGQGEGKLFGHSEEELTQMLMSESIEEAIPYSLIPVNPSLSMEQVEALWGKLLQLYKAAPKVIDLAEVVYEGGFFGPTATAG